MTREEIDRLISVLEEEREKNQTYNSDILPVYNRSTPMTSPSGRDIVLRRSAPGSVIKDSRVMIPVDGTVRMQNCTFTNCRIIDARTIKVTYKKGLICF